MVVVMVMDMVVVIVMVVVMDMVVPASIDTVNVASVNY